MYKFVTLCVSVFLLTVSVESAHRQKRSFVQFGLMLHALIDDKWPWEYNDYGCYCGIGGQGPSLDGIDQCCLVHDKCYEDVPKQNKDCTFPYLPYTVLYGVNYDPLECTDPEGSCERLTCECDKVASYCFAANTYHPGLLRIKDCDDCKGYDDITNIKVTGAKSATAKKEGVSSTGVPASQYIVDQDIAELEQYRSCFVQIGQEHGIHPALVGGLASRVSRAGKLLTAQGFSTRDASKYGLMQCDTRLLGTQCTQYGPKSCEHIQMMVREKLVPDLWKALEKHSINKERKAQRDAVAAYEHTITEVQSWSSPDSKTNGGDFSSDVISRAHRLIYHHNWTCDGTTQSPWLSGGIPFTPSVSPDSDTCKKRAERGDCEFYTECVEKKLPCFEDGYTLGYGHRYCTRFVQVYNDFSAQGKAWIDAVKICLMKALLPQTSTRMTCDRIKKVALDSQLKCFAPTGIDMCSFAGNDLNNMWKVFEVDSTFKEAMAFATWKQILIHVFSCTGSAFQDGKALLEGIHGEINAWQKSEIGEALETTERKKRRKRSLDCDQYARWGDCRFYECFEAKFACSEHYGYSHILDFELPSCMKFSGLSLSNLQVGLWMTSTQHCLMDHLMALYEKESVDCEMVQIHMLEARVSCMIDAGFCSLDTTDEWIIERATDRKGYPFISPKAYTTRPENNDFVLIADYYYQELPLFKKVIGLANKKCHSLGQRKTEELYKLVDTPTLGQFKIRTDL